jgi:hypothetical protein
MHYESTVLILLHNILLAHFLREKRVYSVFFATRKMAIGRTLLQHWRSLVIQEGRQEKQELYFFAEDGKVQFSDPAYKSYKLKDSTTLSLIKGDGSEFDYFYNITDGKLALSPRTVMCIEGCSEIYRKMEE